MLSPEHLLNEHGTAYATVSMYIYLTFVTLRISKMLRISCVINKMCDSTYASCAGYVSGVLLGVQCGFCFCNSNLS